MSANLPDPTYRINPETRARIAPQFDAQALERLLQHLAADARQSFIEQFLVSAPVTADAGGRVPDVSILTRISDPVLQDLLEEVWQPFWQTMPPAALADPHSPYPGRERARRRRNDQEP